MAGPLKPGFEAEVRQCLTGLSSSLDLEVFEYVTAAAASLLCEFQDSEALDEELLDCLSPHLEAAGLSGKAIVPDLRALAFPPREQETCHAAILERIEDDYLCNVGGLVLMYGGGGARLLDRATLRLVRGRRYGVLGGNGGGKTTLLEKIAAGELEALRGIARSYVHYEGILRGVGGSMKCGEYVTGRGSSVQALLEAGFSEELIGKEVGQLSGGWKMRLGLVVALAQRADLLLLDEPTNHLDSAAREWLADHLRASTCTLLVVSHDEAFLQEVCTDAIHFTTDGKLFYSPGLQTRSLKPSANSGMAFPQPGRDGIGHVVATLSGCCFRYAVNGPLALSEASLQLTMRCRVGVAGPNGAGKSTLLQLLAGELLPISEDGAAGSLWRHPDLRMAFVAQQHFFHVAAHLEETPVQYVQNRFGGGWDEELRQRLRLPQSENAVKYRRDMAGKYGGKPYFWSEGEKGWRGREVEAVLRRRETAGRLEYLVSWMVEECEDAEEVQPAPTWEPAAKLQHMGLEMLCVAYDSRSAHGTMAPREVGSWEVLQHFKALGVSEAMAQRPMKGFSAGQLSKVVLAAAFWTRPHMLLLDEPTNFLDADALADLAQAARGFQGGVVVASHSAEFLRGLCSEFWQVERGCVSVLGQDGTSKDALVKAKLQQRQAKEQAKQNRGLEKDLGSAVSWACSQEDVGRVLNEAAVRDAFQAFIGASLPEHALQFAVESLVSISEERKPSGSEDWLSAVVGTVQMVESIGFEQLGDMDHMAPILLALLRHLLRTNAVGSTDGGYNLKGCHISRLRSLRWREKATFFLECCYCGRDLSSEQLEGHERRCFMSPSRCGRRLEGSLFEMFHGTSEKCAAAIERGGFIASVGGMLGPGVYCSRDLRKARRYGAVVLRLQVSLGRVIRIDRRDHPLRLIWQSQLGGKFDCAWVPPNCGVVPSGLEENCVRSPSQITVLGRVGTDVRTLF